MVNPDFRDLFAALNEANASYLVVGAHAVAFYAEPRFTKALDVWVQASAANAARVLAALRAFGAPLAEVTEADFSHARAPCCKSGWPPNRIELTTHIDGVAFDDAWPNRVVTAFGDQSVWIIGRAQLIQNKTATGRPQDLLDLANLAKHE